MMEGRNLVKLEMLHERLWKKLNKTYKIRPGDGKEYEKNK